MGRLIYSILMSLDGFVEDASGSFDWAAPDAEVHAFVNDLARPVGTHLYGRRMFEVMAAWQTLGTEPGEPPEIVDFGQIWRAADKVVYSTSLAAVETPRTRLERGFDTGAVRALKDRGGADLMIGGPELAALALRAGLVDEIDLFVAPVSVGGGKPALPVGVRLDLDLVAERRFSGGMVHLRYAVRSADRG
ncbi:MAG TPA: dihydrofolate reductase family protein [Actinomycetota bacterium]